MHVKTRKTIFQLFVCLICILPLLLTGCQGQSTEAAATSAPQSTEAAATSTPQSTAEASAAQDSSTTTTQPGGEPPDGGQPGGQPGDASGSPDSGSVHSTAAIYIVNGVRDSSNEYTDDSVTIADSGNISDSAASLLRKEMRLNKAVLKIACRFEGSSSMRRPTTKMNTSLVSSASQF